MRKKPGLCISLLAYPRLAILDEPFSGLDPQGISNFKQVLADLTAKGTAILLSTHFLELLEKHYDGLILLQRVSEVPRKPGGIRKHPWRRFLPGGGLSEVHSERRTALRDEAGVHPKREGTQGGRPRSSSPSVRGA